MENKGLSSSSQEMFKNVGMIVTRILEESNKFGQVIQDFTNRLTEIIVPVEKAIDEISITVGHTIAVFAKNYKAISILGEFQYVRWENLSQEETDAIIASSNINKDLRLMHEKKRYKSVDATISLCMQSDIMTPFKRIFTQSVDAFKSGDCDLAVVGFFNLIDGLLSDVSGNIDTQIPKRVNIITEKLTCDMPLCIDEINFIILMITFEATSRSISCFSNFAEKEPSYLNRHWVMHGRSRRRRTKLDCVKLINYIYGIILFDKYNHETLELEQ